jgi:glucuronokinase
MAEARGSAPARTALVGNPSDGYGGTVLSVALDEFGAAATARVRLDSAGFSAPSGHKFQPSVRVTPDSTLVEAAVRRFARQFIAVSGTLEWTTSIPEGVGLGGSSAIVIACVRALCALQGVSLDRDELAAFALAVEREDLGIAGGNQDQTAEVYGGLTLMDFAPGGLHVALDPGLLPPLVVAWRTDAAESSGIVHKDLRARWAAGEASLRDAVVQLTALARDAARALRSGAFDRFAECVDRSFDLRRQMLALDPRHVAMVTAARAAGASANYSGSGGAIVAVCESEPHRERVLEALRDAGCSVLAPAFSARGAAVG